MKLILFGTSACHLCEQAEVILTIILIKFSQLELELIDIAEESQWQQRYAIRIPVLYQPDNETELGWPFNEHDVINFINNA